jgi:hypothetical protein
MPEISAGHHFSLSPPFKGLARRRSRVLLYEVCVNRYFIVRYSNHMPWVSVLLIALLVISVVLGVHWAIVTHALLVVLDVYMDTKISRARKIDGISGA